MRGWRPKALRASPSSAPLGAPSPARREGDPQPHLMLESEPPMPHDALDPRFRTLIDEHAPVRQLGSGFTFTEGPIWHPTEHHLLFSDMPADVRRRWDQAGVREVARPSHKANGMT